MSETSRQNVVDFPDALGEDPYEGASEIQETDRVHSIGSAPKAASKQAPAKVWEIGDGRYRIFPRKDGS